MRSKVTCKQIKKFNIMRKIHFLNLFCSLRTTHKMFEKDMVFNPFLNWCSLIKNYNSELQSSTDTPRKCCRVILKSRLWFL